MKTLSHSREISRRCLLAALGVTCLAFGAAVVQSPLLAQAARTADTSWAAVAQAFGRTGSMQPGGVYKFGMPRTDLIVRIAGVTLKPALALGSWLAFRHGSTAKQGRSMGDLVLLETQVGPV